MALGKWKLPRTGKDIVRHSEKFENCVANNVTESEDRVVAILSDDPMKKKPFTQGIDAHCLNAYGYFKDQMQGITEDNLNDIKDIYPDLRQDSKAPTFA